MGQPDGAQIVLREEMELCAESSGFGESEEGWQGGRGGQLLSLVQGIEGVCCLPTLDPHH